MELRDCLVSLRDSSLFFLNKPFMNLSGGGRGTSVRLRLLPLPLDVEGPADMQCGGLRCLRGTERTKTDRGRWGSFGWRKRPFLDAR